MMKFFQCHYSPIANYVFMNPSDVNQWPAVVVEYHYYNYPLGLVHVVMISPLTLTICRDLLTRLCEAEYYVC